MRRGDDACALIFPGVLSNDGSCTADGTRFIAYDAVAKTPLHAVMDFATWVSGRRGPCQRTKRRLRNRADDDRSSKPRDPDD